MITLAEQNRATRDFFRSELKGFEAANKAALRSTAAALKREVTKQLRTFKKGPSSNGSFQKAVKVKELPPKGGLPLAEIVRLGVPFMGAFEEGATIQGKPNLIILLPKGAALGFRRITKGNTWATVWNRIQKRAKIIPVSDGQVIGIVDKTGATIPIYKIQKQVTVPKKLSFFDTAEKLANTIPEEIARLLGGG
jgi:hypothetical protein